MNYDREEIVWIADGIKGLLLAKNNTDSFPQDFYEQAKRLIGFKNVQ